MPRDYLQYLEDIILSSKKIIKYVEGYTFEQFQEDEKTIDAVTRNFEIIGIAAKNVPEQIKAKNPDIDWRKVINFRNVLAHEYFGINTKVLWDTMKNRVPELADKVESILKEEES